MTDYTQREITIDTPQGPLPCLLREPRRFCAAPCVFLCFFGGAGESLEHDAARRFLSAGHRAMSFDLPCFGLRADEAGEGEQGLCAAYMALEDPFLRFVSDARGAMDALSGMAAGFYAVGGHIGGYMAMRLMEREPRILAGAALSPVVDFSALDEWREVADLREVEELSLCRFAAGLSGRPLYLSVGNHDRRVGTRAVCRFYCAVYDENERIGFDNGLLDLHCTELSDCGAGAADFLLELAGL